MAGEDPDLAVYAQHGYAEAREWPHVEKQGQRPVVYIAQGSHAAYFDDGASLTHWHRTEHFIDRADGRITPKTDLKLEVFEESGPAWARWPGHWGDTERPTVGPKPYRDMSSGSPTGPGQKPHWIDPGWLLQKADDVGRAPRRAAPSLPTAPRPPAPPRLTPRFEDGRLRLGYDVAPKEGERIPTHLLVTVNSPDDPFPPTTFRLELEGRRGKVEVPLDVDPGRRYELRASGLTADGALSEPEQIEVPAAGLSLRRSMGRRSS
jgi:hypothetical protein